MKKRILIMLLCGLIVSLSGCQSQNSSNVQEDSQLPEKIILAEQFGLAYAPLQIMKEKAFLESVLKDNGFKNIAIEWKQLGNTAAIRESMLSGDLDIGFVGIPPFLLGVENGMDWKMMCGISESRVSLITKDQKVQSLADLTLSHRIILPQPGSIQHILLQMAAEKQLGTAQAFDNQLLALSHPDGVTSFVSGDESILHFTTPPFIQSELAVEGAREILTGQEAFGDEFTFIVAICPERFTQNDLVYQSVVRALELSVQFMKENPEETISILAQAYEYPLDDLERYLESGQMAFSTEVHGVQTFIDFMLKNGDLKTNYDEKDLFWKK